MSDNKALVVTLLSLQFGCHYGIIFYPQKSAGLLRVAVVQRPELETNRSSQKIRYASSFSTSRSI